MWNGSDVLALAAIAAGTAGSLALYSLLSDGFTRDHQRTIVVEVRQPARVVPLPLHRPDAWDVEVRHVPRVMVQTIVERGADGSIVVDGRRIRIERAQKLPDIEKRRDPRPDRKRKRRRRDRP